MSLHATSLVVSWPGTRFEIMFENASQQTAVRLPRSLLIHLSREIARALGTPQGVTPAPDLKHI